MTTISERRPTPPTDGGAPSGPRLKSMAKRCPVTAPRWRACAAAARQLEAAIEPATARAVQGTSASITRNDEHLGRAATLAAVLAHVRKDGGDRSKIARRHRRATSGRTERSAAETVPLPHADGGAHRRRNADQLPPRRRHARPYRQCPRSRQADPRAGPTTRPATAPARALPSTTTAPATMRAGPPKPTIPQPLIDRKGLIP